MAEKGDTHHLIERSTQGDEFAKSTLLAENLPALLAFVRLNASPVVRDHESCADIVQSVCREVLDDDLAGFEYRGEAEFRNWLFTRAVNKLNNRQRYYLAKKRDARRTLPVTNPELLSGVSRLYASIASPTENAVAAETARRLEAAFAELPEIDRQVISMSRIAAMSHGEIAAALGDNESTVRGRLHRGLARLGRLMYASGRDAHE